jgi:hypothetical protein
MIRGRKNVSVVVRGPNGELSTLTEPLGSFSSDSIRKIPFVRGVATLIETLVLGIRTLLYSANMSLGEEEEISSKALWGTAALGIVFALALFLALPLVVTNYFVDPYISSPLLSNVADSLIRFGIVILYLKVLGFLPDIHRVFAYHGAEHKVVNAYEAGVPLEVEEVKKYSTAHARCGTAFLLIVLVIALIVFAFIGQPAMWIRLLSRIALLPFIAALGYELLRFTAEHSENPLIQIVLAPGLALQKLVTHEPDDHQIEVAISALKSALANDENGSEVSEVAV